MPDIYTIKMTDGRSFDMPFDREPTEADVLAFIKANPNVGKPTVFDDPALPVGLKAMRPDAPARFKASALKLTDVLPAAGSITGGVVGGASGAATGGPVGAVTGGLLGAGVGRMGGQSLRDTIHQVAGSEDRPKSVGQVALRAADATRQGMTEQAVGSVIPAAMMATGRGMESAGTKLLGSALKINKTTAASDLNPSFGRDLVDKTKNAARELHDRGYVTVGQSGQHRLESDLSRLNNQLAYAVEQRAGQPVNVEPAIAAGYETATQKAAQVNNTNAIDQVQQEVLGFLQSHGLAPKPTWTTTTPGRTLPAAQGQFADRAGQVGAAVGQTSGSGPVTFKARSINVPVQGGVGVQRVEMPGMTVGGTSGSPAPVDWTLPQGRVPATTQTMTVDNLPPWSPLMGSAPPERTLPIEKVNAIRAGTWANLRDRINMNEPVTSAQVATTRNINSGLAAAQREAMPEAVSLLDEAGKLQGLREVLDEASWRIGNRQPGNFQFIAASGPVRTGIAAAGIPAVGKIAGKGARNLGMAAMNAAEEMPWQALARSYLLTMLGLQEDER